MPPAVHRQYSSTSLSCFIVAEAPPGLADFLEAQAGLGRGESEAIAMAHLSGTTILIDDLKARKVAKKLGCRISGTAAPFRAIRNIITRTSAELDLTNQAAKETQS